MGHGQWGTEVEIVELFFLQLNSSGLSLQDQRVASSMISRQFWEKRQPLLTWHDTVFGGGMVMILRLVIERC